MPDLPLHGVPAEVIAGLEVMCTAERSTISAVAVRGWPSGPGGPTTPDC